MITPQGLANLFAEMEALRPTLIVHPDDAAGVREAVEKLSLVAKIEVTELVRPGEVMVYRGLKRPVLDLGEV